MAPENRSRALRAPRAGTDDSPTPAPGIPSFTLGELVWTLSGRIGRIEGRCTRSAMRLDDSDELDVYTVTVGATCIRLTRRELCEAALRAGPGS
jgi:hypothetical protein